ncbi:preprotein translocase subunit SecA [Legionella sp. PC997]|uniref:preprotein translocase subunit SecA n=1 Tax=Legionella sp. PC997 TaxID=2755562 RepID=UPI0015FBC3EC|nr:preprotein translocase subunit SecA [Legionella sp. PC997]QMT60000.1 Protein translocase subunit SecA [Legionella sp. PC997]
MHDSVVPFLYIKKQPTSFFSGSDKPKYMWSSSESGVINDVSFTLLKSVLSWYRNPFTEKISALVPKDTQTIKKNDNKQFWKSRKGYISLETIAELDDIGNWRDKSFLINILLDEFNIYLQEGFTIGINFREIFLVPEGEEPPSHFRPGIDLCVRSHVEYKEMTGRLSYQLGKAIFYRYKPFISSDRTKDSVNQTIIDYYSNNPFCSTWNKPYIDYTTSLKNYHFFDSAFACFIAYKMPLSYEYLSASRPISKVVALTYPVQVTELLPFFQNSTAYGNQELTIVLKGSQYKDKSIRQSVYEEIAQLIKESKCTSMIHLFLITKDDIDANLLALKPESQEKNSLYESLPQDAGYYLSSSKLLSLTYRNIQSIALSSELFDKELRVLDKVYEGRAKKKPGAYIYAKEVSNNIRKSKTMTISQLKSKARLSVTQQQSVAQTQVVNQQVQETHQQTLNQQTMQNVAISTQMTSKSSWDLKVNLDSFCKRLESCAKKYLSQVTDEEQLFKQAGCLTEFYLKHHSRSQFYNQLANDKGFRLQMAAKLFGTALVSKHDSSSLVKIKLPHYAVDNIEVVVANSLIANIESVRDGLFEKYREVKDYYLFGQTIDNYTLVSYRSHIIPSLALSQLWNMPTKSQEEHLARPFVPSLSYNILLSEEELASVESGKKLELIECVESLLKLFKPHPPCNPEEIRILEQQMLVLIRFYCLNRSEEIEQIEDFIKCFPTHNEDNLKILLHVLTCSHKKGLDSLLKLLSFLNDRGLLAYFYKIYFQYAVDTSVLKELLNSPLRSIFLRLAARIPIAKSKESWPDFERFCLHLSLFAAQNNFQLDANDLRTVENLWRRLYAKFLAYSGNKETEAQKLLSQLTLNLIDEHSLCIAPVSKLDTFCTGLEYLLDHAMSKQMLEEQIEEIKGISLLPMDAPYACEWNGFRLVSSEMQIYSSAINPENKAYSISPDELLQIMCSHQPGNDDLKVAVFRYLGTQNLREHLSFYRNLYQSLTQKAIEPNERDIAELLFSFYVIQFTGKGYYRDIDKEQFTNQLILFLKNQNLYHLLPTQKVYSLIDDLFLSLSQSTTDKQKGTISIWCLWREQQNFSHKITKPIPEIFLRKFSRNNIGHFLLTQKENLIQSLPDINDVGENAWSLINVWCDELNSSPEYKKIVRHYLMTLYPEMDMGILLRDIDKIAVFLHSITSVYQMNSRSLIYLVFDQFLDKTPNKEAFFSLSELVMNEMAKHQNPASKDKLTNSFLLILRNSSKLYQGLPQTKDLISLLLDTFFKMEITESPKLLFTLMEILLPLGMDEAQQLFKKLLPMVASEEGRKFLKFHSDLNTTQLKEIILFAQNVKSPALALSALEWLFQQGLSKELTGMTSLFEQKDEEDIRCLLLLGQILYQKKDKSLLTQLHKLNNKPIQVLKKIVCLYQLKTANAEEVVELLSTSSLEEGIALFLRKKYQNNLERYDYHSERVREHIAQIKLKSPESDDDLPLSHQEQEELWHDYQFLMSFLAKKTIKINFRGSNKEVTINELTEKEFQLLFKELQEQIKNGLNVHRNQLLLIALSAEALYRTTNKFPRHTQILTLLKHLHHPGNIIHEIKTGEGKSIVAAMHAVLLCGNGRTVDIVTENEQLAKNALEKFAPFYQYLGIPHGTSIVAAQSTHSEYIPNGINYSTASDLSLFRMRMALEKRAMPTNPSLIGDEIDATLTSTVQFRLAAPIDFISNDTKFCHQMNQLVLDFVKEKEIYLNNPCSQTDDILNLKNYFIAKNPNKEFLDFTQKVSDEILGILIESAMIAQELEENEDYYIVKKKDSKNEYFYAAPIIASTKRPAPYVNYSDYVQQLLHTLLNNKQPPPAYPFKIEPNTETILATSSKNFFDYYRLHEGPIIGLTATAGACVERAEFFEQQGLVAYSYPSFYPDRSTDLGLITVFGKEALLQKTFEWIKQHKQQNPTQPILLITRSPQATEQFKNFIMSQTDWKIQSYHGLEDAGKSEENIIYTAGKDDVLTAANQSLARGADIDPEHEYGLLAINTCTDLTPSELRQIQGRAARNGKPGQFISIIDAQNLGSPSDSAESLAAAYKRHQLDISISQQKMRAKSRLLEESRYCIVSHLLKLREAADKILASQFGEEHSIADHQQLMRSLSSLNRRAEKHYAKLLEQHSEIDDETANEFLFTLINDYQQVLDNWLPEDQFRQMQFVQPSIPLESLKMLSLKLQKTSVGQLRNFAEIFHRKWKLDGHKQTKQHLDSLDELAELFEPYFKKRCSFKFALGHALNQKELLETEKINAQFTVIKKSIDEMLEFAQSIPVIGKLVPVVSIRTYVEQYLDVTKNQIREKKWDEISPPTIDISSITNWFQGVSHILSVSSILIGGPMSFVIKRFIIPTILGWIKKALKRSFANSESLVAQILIGIDDIGNDLSEAINALTTLDKEKNITVGLLLDKFGPLLRNKALLLALSKYLQLIEKPQYIPWLEAIPDVLAMFERYRNNKPDELLKVNTVMLFLKQAASSKLILKVLKNSSYHESFQRLSQLDSRFVNQMSALSFTDFINLIRIAAHPNFFILMEKLPEKTTFVELAQWLESIPEDLPNETRQTIQELLDYQRNHERIAEENKQNILNLRKKGHLTLSKFKDELEKLKPVCKPGGLKPEPEVKESSKPFDMKNLVFLLVVAAFISYSVLYFSIPIALVSLALAAWILAPTVRNHFSQQENELVKSSENSLSSEDVPSFILKEDLKSQLITGKTNNIVREVKESTLSGIGEAKLGFFRGKIQKNEKGIMENKLPPTFIDQELQVQQLIGHASLSSR